MNPSKHTTTTTKENTMSILNIFGKKKEQPPQPTASPQRFAAYTSLELRIKGFTLAQETRFIRKYEKRLRRASRHVPALEDKRVSLNQHRIFTVRPEARATYLAYGFLRGRSYLSMEETRYSDPDWTKIETMVNRYGEGDNRDRMQRFAEWKAEAGEPKEHEVPRKKRFRVSKGKPDSASAAGEV